MATDPLSPRTLSASNLRGWEDGQAVGGVPENTGGLGDAEGSIEHKTQGEINSPTEAASKDPSADSTAHEATACTEPITGEPAEINSTGQHALKTYSDEAGKPGSSVYIDLAMTLLNFILKAQVANTEQIPATSPTHGDEEVAVGNDATTAAAAAAAAAVVEGVTKSTVENSKEREDDEIPLETKESATEVPEPAVENMETFGGFLGLVSRARDPEFLEAVIGKFGFVDVVDTEGRTLLSQLLNPSDTQALQEAETLASEESMPSEESGSDQVVNNDTQEEDWEKIPEEEDLPPLSASTIANTLKAMQTIVSRTKSVNTQQKNGDAALHLTVRSGAAPDLAPFLLTHGADVNLANQRGQTPLHLAAGRKDEGRSLRVLLEEASKSEIKPNVNVQDHNNHTPLDIALSRGSLSAVRLLKEYGAEVGSHGRENALLPLIRTIHSDPREEVIDELMRAERPAMISDVCEVPPSWYPPLLAVPPSSSGPSEATLVTEAGGEKESNKTTSGVKGNAHDSEGREMPTTQKYGSVQPLAEEGQTTNESDGKAPEEEEVKANNCGTTESATPDLPTRKARRTTALHIAVAAGKKDAIQNMLDRSGSEAIGCALRITDDEGNTPLHVASITGNWEIVKLLVKEENRTRVSAATSESTEEVEQLHREGKRGEEGEEETIMDKKSSEAPSEKMSTTLSNVRKIPYGQNTAGLTPLHYSAVRFDGDAAAALEASGCETSAADTMGNTPLHIACQPYREACEATGLLKFCDDAEVAKAAGAAQQQAIAFFAKGGKAVNARRYDGATPLHLFVASGLPAEAAEPLFDNGADINIGDEAGQTAIHRILAEREETGDEAVAEKLDAFLSLAENSQCAPKLEPQDPSQGSYLEEAVLGSHASTVSVLMKHGADAGVEVTEKGGNLLAVALANGNEKVVEALLTGTKRASIVDQVTIPTTMWPEHAQARVQAEPKVAASTRGSVSMSATAWGSPSKPTTTWDWSSDQTWGLGTDNIRYEHEGVVAETADGLAGKLPAEGVAAGEGGAEGEEGSPSPDNMMSPLQWAVWFGYQDLVEVLVKHLKHETVTLTPAPLPAAVENETASGDFGGSSWQEDKDNTVPWGMSKSPSWRSTASASPSSWPTWQTEETVVPSPTEALSPWGGHSPAISPAVTVHDDDVFFSEGKDAGVPSGGEWPSSAVSSTKAKRKTGKARTIKAIDAPNANGESALLMAVDAGNMSIVRTLLNNNASAAGHLSDGAPLRRAIQKGNKEIIELLLDNGAVRGVAQEKLEQIVEDAINSGSDISDIVPLVIKAGVVAKYFEGKKRLGQLLKGRKESTPVGLEGMIAAVTAEKETQLREKKAAIQVKNEAVKEKEAAVKAKNEAVEEKEAAVKAKNEAVEEREAAVKAKNEAVECEEAAIKAKNEAVKEKEAAVKAKNEAVEREEAAVKAKNEAVEEKEAAVKAKNEAVEREEAAVKAKNEAVEEKEAAVKAKNEAVEREEAAVKAKNEAVEEKEAAVKAKNEAVEREEAAVKAKNEAVEEKEAAVKAKNEAVEREEAAVKAKNEAVEEKEAAVKAKNEAVEEKEAAVKAKNEAVEEKEAAVKAKNEAFEREEAAVKAKHEAFEREEAAIKAKNESVEREEAAVKAKNEAVEREEAAIKAKNEAVEEKEAAVKAKNEAVEREEAAVKAKNEAVEEKEAAVTAKNEAVEEKEAAVKAKNEAVEEKEAAVKAKNEAVEREEAAVKAKNEAVEEKEAAVKAKNEAVEREEAAVKAKNEAVEEKEAAVKAKNEAVKEKEAARQEALARTSALEAQLQRLQVELELARQAAATAEANHRSALQRNVDIDGAIQRLEEHAKLTVETASSSVGETVKDTAVASTRRLVRDTYTRLVETIAARAGGEGGEGGGKGEESKEEVPSPFTQRHNSSLEDIHRTLVSTYAGCLVIRLVWVS